MTISDNPGEGDAEALIRQTRDVVIHPGDPTEWHVQVVGTRAAVNVEIESLRSLVFTPEEFAPVKECETPPVVAEYHRVFFQRPSIRAEDWNDEILPAWEGQQRVRDRDVTTNGDW